MGYASAASWVLFVIILSITLVQFRLQRRWVTYA
jgi:multiple sugar transport system permease protein